MQDRDAKLAVGVDVWMDKGPHELKFCIFNSLDREYRKGFRCLTRRRVWVVFRKLHFRLQVTAVEEGVGVDDDQGDIPVEDIIPIQLERGKSHRACRAP